MINLFFRLCDPDSEVRQNTVVVLTHLILSDMVKVKGQLSEMALCLEDSVPRIVDRVKLFFMELSRKVRVCTCMYIHVCMYVHVCLYMYMYMYVFMYTYVLMHVQYMCICIIMVYVRTCTCTVHIFCREMLYTIFYQI